METIGRLIVVGLVAAGLSAACGEVDQSQEQTVVVPDEAVPDIAPTAWTDADRAAAWSWMEQNTDPIEDPRLGNAGVVLATRYDAADGIWTAVVLSREGLATPISCEDQDDQVISILVAPGDYIRWFGYLGEDEQEYRTSCRKGDIEVLVKSAVTLPAPSTSLPS